MMLDTRPSETTNNITKNLISMLYNPPNRLLIVYRMTNLDHEQWSRHSA